MSVCQAKALAAKAIAERREKAATARTDPDFKKAVDKLRESTKKIQDERAKHKTIFLEHAPKMQLEGPGAKCKARTMENKPCPFRATCGQFCKRHKV